MASKQDISVLSTKSLAAAPVDAQHGRDALQTLLELNDEVDLMVANPLSSEMQRYVSLHCSIQV